MLLVLRFRDLGIPSGETIHRHRQVIATHDQCWWGWWSRRHESDPLPILSAIAFPSAVMLFDSDGMQMFSADCMEARGSATEMLSPAVEQTPDYYNGRRLRAWFRFREIEPCTSEDVIGMSCFSTSIGVVEPEVVTSLEVLRDSHPTMWLLHRNNR